MSAISKDKQEQERIKGLIKAQAGSMMAIWNSEADEVWFTASKLSADKNEPLLDLEAIR